MPRLFLQIHRVSCHVGTVQALSHVTLSLPPRARCLVAGPSGAGKTTLLRWIAGLQAPSEGSLHVDGADITSLPPERRGFGWVGPDPGLLPGLEAVGQVELALRSAPMSSTQRREASRRALESFGLGHRLGHFPHQLSSGEALRVALARACVSASRCLLLDEPLARIDPAQRTSLRRWLSRWQDETGGAVIETSHWLHESFHGASHVLLLRDGRLVQFGEAQAVWRSPASPWVADFLSILPLWWSKPVDAIRNGWLGSFPAHAAASQLVGVRLDGASWHASPDRLPSLGPLRVLQFQDVGLLPCIEAVFPDGEIRWVPWRHMDAPPVPGAIGWARFNQDAVVVAMSDDRA